MAIQFGKYSTLRVSARFEFGLELTDEKDIVLLPAAELENRQVRVGDKVRVFIYGDRAGKLAATLMTPLALPGEIASLQIFEIAEKSVWLEWGLHFHLRIAPDDICVPIQEGMYLPVKILSDPMSMRFHANNRIDDYLEDAPLDLEVGTEVKIMAYRPTPMGYAVIVDSKYSGLIFHSDLQERLRPGMMKKAFIKQVREDGKLDISLVPAGYENAIDHITQKVWDKLEASPYGFLPYHDKTDPEVIQREFGLSKKNFKKALGNLFKMGKAEKDEGGTRVKKP